MYFSLSSLFTEHSHLVRCVNSFRLCDFAAPKGALESNTCEHSQQVQFYGLQYKYCICNAVALPLDFRQERLPTLPMDLK